MKKLTKDSRIMSVDEKGYEGLLTGVSELLEQARHGAARSVNQILTATYWEIGGRIVEFEQAGKDRAQYGEELLKRLSKDLTARFGKGFGLTNLKMIRKFFITYHNRVKSQPVSDLLHGHAKDQKSQTASDLLPVGIISSDVGLKKVQALSALSSPLMTSEILQSVSGEFPLSWSHYVRLLSLDELERREFYEEEAQRAGWSVRQLERQINSMLYERVALSKKKGELLKKAEGSGNLVTAEEAIRDPYVLEFLGLPEPISEKDLENALIQHMADFLLELGYGFTFVARQKRLQVGSESYYLDLLFYHRGLQCLVAIDLKVGNFTHADAGQMNLYLNYLLENEKMGNENDPIGLILCSEKDEAVAHYALGRLSNKIFASRYKLQLPDPEILKREIEAERRRLEMRILERKQN
jgi:predicted nuclease of restriction endonuclease-like (RecB) superfamily